MWFTLGKLTNSEVVGSRPALVVVFFVQPQVIQNINTLNLNKRANNQGKVSSMKFQYHLLVVNRKLLVWNYSVKSNTIELIERWIDKMMSAQTEDNTLHTFTLEPPSLSWSLYSVKIMDAYMHCTKKEPDHFSVKPQIRYIELNGRTMPRVDLLLSTRHFSRMSTSRITFPGTKTS